MEFLWDLFHRIYDVESIVRTGGLVALIVIVFVETGLLVGFFLPGDSLLVTAGFFAARGDLDLLTLNTTLSLAAIPGVSVGYGIVVVICLSLLPAIITLAHERCKMRTQASSSSQRNRI